MLFVTYSLHQNSHISTFCSRAATTCRIYSPTAIHYTTRYSTATTEDRCRYASCCRALGSAVVQIRGRSKLGAFPIGFYLSQLTRFRGKPEAVPGTEADGNCVRPDSGIDSRDEHVVIEMNRLLDAATLRDDN